jgi:hypothetical protein
MNKIRMDKNIGLVVLLAGLSACVTINIYFPAAAAEKAADKIIEEVWQLEEGKNKPAETPETKSQTKPETKPEAKPGDIPAK